MKKVSSIEKKPSLKAKIKNVSSKTKPKITKQIKKPIAKIEVKHTKKVIPKIKDAKLQVKHTKKIIPKIKDSKKSFTKPREVSVNKIKPSLKSKIGDKLKKIGFGAKKVVAEKPTHLNELELKKFHEDIVKIKKEMSKVVVGQERVIDSILIALISGGHVLLEGVPGIAKTLIMRALSYVTSCKTKRIQFTADLLPTDIVGLTSYEKSKGFFVIKGPIFTNFMLADEINRAPGKTQGALLEAMQEKQVTIGRQTFGIDHPFFVLATMNPIETMGTYPLPEAQIDRFLFKLFIDYPKIEEERKVLEKNISLRDFGEYGLQPVVSPLDILKMQITARKIYVNDAVRHYIVKLIDATRHPSKYNLKHAKYIRFGSSPRASIGMYIASKANALMKGKDYVTPQDVKEIAHDVLRHRILLNYEGQAENIDRNVIIDELLAKIPIP